MPRPEVITNILATLPTSPGVYQYFDDKGEIIYVGKAKNLKRRVLSYFTKEQSGKVKLLVSRIADLKFIVVDSESEALLLENNLIKRYKPRFNILLKDDKTYPWICIKNEKFPRVFLTRRKINDGSLYFGPYSSTLAARTLLDLLFKVYPLRTCKLDLSDKNIKNNHFRACLEYHIGNCKAPCVGEIDTTEYGSMIKDIKEVIGGNIQSVLRSLKEQMMTYAASMEFEKAQQIKIKYDLLEGYRSRSVVVSSSIFDVDVFSFEDADSTFYVNYLKVIRGSVVQSHSFEIKRRLDETCEELLLLALTDVRQSLNSKAPEIIVPIALDIDLKDIKITVPKRGEKLQLLNLSIRNAKQYRMEIEKIRSLSDPERHSKELLADIQKALHLPKLPLVIESFDNSNFQGDYAVASMVQFVNGKPNKSAYRKYNIKTVEGPDDYASMAEVVYRRYKRLIDEEQKLPDLILVDGGKGQMEVVREATEDKLQIKIPIAGMVKNEHHRTSELLYGFPPLAVGLRPNDQLFHLLERIQDEVHRFAISFHRQKFTKGFISSELDQIKGIGAVTKQTLLLHFKSVKKIKEAPLEDLSAVIGKAKSTIVYEYFHTTTQQ